MLRRFETFVTEIIDGKRQGTLASCVKAALSPPSWAFRLASDVRKTAYDSGWLSQFRATVPVVSIGNIVAGGTGKTPVVLQLAKDLLGEVSLGILSRGYRSQAEKRTIPTVVSHGQSHVQAQGQNFHGSSPQFSPALCGDEACLLARNLPTAIVVAGRDRRALAEVAINHGARLLLLDDGMQHRQLARDVEIVVVDAQDPFGRGYFLPRGYLRESPSALRRADLVVLHHSDLCADPVAVEASLRAYTAAPIVWTRIKPSAKIRDYEGNVTGSLEGMKVGAFCGVAKPSRFLEMLKSLGAEVVGQLITADHEGVSSQRLEQFSRECREKGAQQLVCTEKDYVKLSHEDAVSLGIGWVPISIEILREAEQWHELCRRIKQTVP